MSPILGIWASAQQPALNASSFESIATVTVGAGGSSAIEFTSIPSTFTHLQIRGISKSNRTDDYADIFTMRFNGDTGTNYAYHILNGNGANAGASSGTSTGSPLSIMAPANLSSSNIFGAAVVDILDYANTNKYKTSRILTAQDQNNSEGRLYFTSQLWQNTNAITSIKFTSLYGTGFLQYSSFALYGIKGA